MVSAMYTQVAKYYLLFACILFYLNMVLDDMRYEPSHNKTISYKPSGARATLASIAAAIEVRVACMPDGL